VVGVFHRARELDGPPLAQEGDLIGGNKPIGVIETLGIASDVLAPQAGRLHEIVAEDGQAVQYGAVIAVIVAE
ncbi:MAG TPA: biotin/lipoyl-containing protein, partial [Chloroflexota bacterium]|nr:biotin/lipoyl-containing protein [Chloroflexota bacterium]